MANRETAKRVKRTMGDLVTALSEQTGESESSIFDGILAADLSIRQSLGKCGAHGGLHYNQSLCVGFCQATAAEIADDTFARYGSN